MEVQRGQGSGPRVRGQACRDARWRRSRAGHASGSRGARNGPRQPDTTGRSGSTRRETCSSQLPPVGVDGFDDGVGLLERCRPPDLSVLLVEAARGGFVWGESNRPRPRINDPRHHLPLTHPRSIPAAVRRAGHAGAPFSLTHSSQSPGSATGSEQSGQMLSGSPSSRRPKHSSKVGRRHHLRSRSASAASAASVGVQSRVMRLPFRSRHPHARRRRAAVPEGPTFPGWSAARTGSPAGRRHPRPSSGQSGSHGQGRA